MRIAVLGAGQVGTALGKGWTAHGHTVVYGVRNPADPKHAGLKVASIPEAARDAEVVVLATPWPAAPDALRSAGGLAGKIVVDCTNPLGMDASGLHLTAGHTTSGAEQLAANAPGAAFVKAFNTTGFNNMEDAGRFPVRPMMPVAGDDPKAKGVVLDLARAVGFDAVDAGPLRAARLLEPLAMLWIDLALKHGQGRDFAFALVRPGK